MTRVSQQAGQIGFDFTAHMREVCRQIVGGDRRLAHIDLDRVAIAFAQARRRVNYGLQASLTPMRFEGGATTIVRRGRRYAAQRLRDKNGREILYILTFYLPRFMDQPFLEKLITVFHELWHIDPTFNGDLRRHAGRCYAHTHSQAEYDERMRQMALEWLDSGPPAESYDFLKLDFAALRTQYGSVFGLRIPRPKLIPIAPS